MAVTSVQLSYDDVVAARKNLRAALPDVRQRIEKALMDELDSLVALTMDSLVDLTSDERRNPYTQRVVTRPLDAALAELRVLEHQAYVLSRLVVA